MKELLAAAVVALALTPAAAQATPCDVVPTVFDGDPCDPLTGPYPMLPGLPLVLPSDGPRGDWNAGEPIIDNDFIGDVDLAVRVGSFLTEPDVPAPAGSAGNPTLFQNVAGGGNSNQGDEIGFTTFVTDGPGTEMYGTVLTTSELDARPVAVFAYADLDGDGRIGPHSGDGNLDNAIELQEALAHLGRQVGQATSGRFTHTLGIRVGAPASMGGLVVGLAAGMYTGSDSNQLWSDGTPILTQWPFFPPLDPVKIVYLDEPNAPDPEGPNILFYNPSEFFLPAPDHPDLPNVFSVPVDGSNASTDQFVSVSGDVVGARLFRNADPLTYVPSSRLTARVAPGIGGFGRKLVVPAGEIAVAAGNVVELRLLPVDALGNVADPPGGGFDVKLHAEGGLKILTPDFNSNTEFEFVNLDGADGIVVTLGTDSVVGGGTLDVLDPPPALPVIRDQAVVTVSASGDLDTDGDNVPDDGDGSLVVGDSPCTAEAIADEVPCDDNCPDTVNPAQVDTDGDGQGNCCDGTCVIDDETSGCLECAQALSRFRGTFSRVNAKLQPRAAVGPDYVKLNLRFPLDVGQSIAPDGEEVEVSLVEGDRLHYFASLAGALTVRRPGIYVYEDGEGSNAGIRKLRIKVRGTAIKATLVARGFGILDTTPAETIENGLVLSLGIGDDAFTSLVSCTTTLRSIRCAAGQ